MRNSLKKNEDLQTPPISTTKQNALTVTEGK